MEKRLILFTDVGDTIIDEGTEVREIPDGIVLRASCIPGMEQAMKEVYEAGFTIIMNADGYTESFDHTMEQNGLSHIFSGRAISEEVGTHKPDKRMFQAAMDTLGLQDEDKSRIVMLGNNLSRDMAGANAFGIRSIFFNWSPRYPHAPADASERPTYEIYRAEELLPLLNRLEEELETEEAEQEHLRKLYITTYTGKRFNPLYPDPALIDLTDIAHALSLLCRGNGHMTHFYSVGLHSLNCCREAEARGYSRKLQMACLLHDAAEAYVSDLTRPVKSVLAQYREIEDRLLDAIWEKYLPEPLTREEREKVFAIDDEILSFEFLHLMPEKLSDLYLRLKTAPEIGFVEPEIVEHRMLEAAFSLQSLWR